MAQTRKFFRTYQGLIISGVMVVGVVIGVFLGLIPTVQKIITLRSESSVLVGEDELLRAKAATLDDSDEATFKQYLAELAVTLTKPGALATQSAIRLSNEEKQVGSSLLPFSLTVEGSYAQIHNFLATVNRVRRFFRVRYFDIAFSADETVSAKLGMDAFYAPLPTALGSAEQAIEALSPDDQDIIRKVAELPILSEMVSTQSAGQAPLSPTTTSRDDPFAP